MLCKSASSPSTSERNSSAGKVLRKYAMVGPKEPVKKTGSRELCMPTVTTVFFGSSALSAGCAPRAPGPAASPVRSTKSKVKRRPQREAFGWWSMAEFFQKSLSVSTVSFKPTFRLGGESVLRRVVLRGVARPRRPSVLGGGREESSEKFLNIVDFQNFYDRTLRYRGLSQVVNKVLFRSFGFSLHHTDNGIYSRVVSEQDVLRLYFL